MVTKQNQFSRSLINDAKMGAYYTDTQHCQWISNFLEFPEDEVCVLEPSIGDGTALFNVIPDSANMKVFAVELNREVAEKTRQNPRIEKLLMEDFLHVKISHNSFSFCFSNPPYGDSIVNERRVRLEKLFLEKLTMYLKKDAVLVYVVPYHLIVDDSGFLRTWITRYETKGIYKFHEKEFAKYHQIVLFGIKKTLAYEEDELTAILNKYSSIDKVPLLPKDYQGEKIPITPSHCSQIATFSTVAFDVMAAKEFLVNSPLNQLTEKLAQEEYTDNELNTPVLPLKKDLLYLLGVSGGGEGYAGDEDSGDLHLQRGVVKSIETETVEPSGEKNFIVRVNKSNKVSMTIIENNGQIRRLS